MVNGRLVEQKKRTKTEEAKGNYVQIQMIAAMAADNMEKKFKLQKSVF